jgi:hypothetical protein
MLFIIMYISKYVHLSVVLRTHAHICICTYVHMQITMYIFLRLASTKIIWVFFPSETIFLAKFWPGANPTIAGITITWRRSRLECFYNMKENVLALKSTLCRLLVMIKYFHNYIALQYVPWRYYKVTCYLCM